MGGWVLAAQRENGWNLEWADGRSDFLMDGFDCFEQMCVAHGTSEHPPGRALALLAAVQPHKSYKLGGHILSSGTFSHSYGSIRGISLLVTNSLWLCMPFTVRAIHESQASIHRDAQFE
jgi:hypothetical protein